MPKITFLTGDESVTYEAREGQTIAAVASENGLRLYGYCQGANTCSLCKRRVHQGVENLFMKNSDGSLRQISLETQAVQTCQVIAMGDVTIVAERKRSQL